jgi:hypothetical protein
MVRKLIAAAMVAGLAGPAWAGDAPKPVDGKAAFEKMKSLAGEWVGAVEGKGPPATASYKVTAGGSTVMETLFGGTPHEMITMYTLDHGNLVMTHYCAAGNQPHMKLAAASTAEKFQFEFDGGPGIDPSKDMHMHQAVLTFVDADHLDAAWTAFQNGKAGDTHAFHLARKK